MQHSGGSGILPPPTPDLTALREIAEAVEPLEWTVAYGGVGTSVYSNWDNEHGEYAQIVADGMSAEEADHIAAFDPPTVLGLLDRLEAAEATIQRVRELHKPVVGQNGRSYCADCVDDTGRDGPYPIEYPCPTARALDGE